MNVKSIERNGNQATITVEIDKELMESGVQKAYLKARKNIMIPGFRKGKAPRKMIEAMYGAHVFYEDGLEEIFPEVYDAAVTKQDVKAVGRPSLTDMQISEDNVVTIVLTTDVYPEVTLGEYKGIEVEKAEATVADAAPALIIAMAIFAVAFVVIYFSNIPEPHMETAEEKAARLSGKAKKDPHGPMSFRHFVLGAIAIFFYVGVEVGIPNTANLYMSGLEGVGPVVAGTLVGFYWFCMMLGRLLGGAIGAKVSSKQMLTFANILAIVFVLCLMFIPEDVRMSIPGVDAQVPVSMVFMFLCGLCTSVMFGSIFNLAAEGLGKYTPVASGIFMALICGGGILPFIQGLVADAAGFINSYWVVIVGLAYMLFYAVAGSKNVNKDIPVE